MTNNVSPNARPIPVWTPCAIEVGDYVEKIARQHGQTIFTMNSTLLTLIDSPDMEPPLAAKSLTEHLVENRDDLRILMERVAQMLDEESDSPFHEDSPTFHALVVLHNEKRAARDVDVQSKAFIKDYATAVFAFIKDHKWHSITYFGEDEPHRDYGQKLADEYGWHLQQLFARSYYKSNSDDLIARMDKLRRALQGLMWNTANNEETVNHAIANMLANVGAIPRPAPLT